MFVNNDIYLKRKEKKHVILTFEFNNLNEKIQLFEDLIAYTYIFIYNMSIAYISRYTCFEWLVLKIIDIISFIYRIVVFVNNMFTTLY